MSHSPAAAQVVARDPRMTERQWEIDALRGLMLVLITVTHLPTRFALPLGQPFGFVSAAEGFVLLSAYMGGLVYTRLAARNGTGSMQRAFLKRALKIYLCQAGVLVFLFTIIAWVGLKIDQPAVKNLMSYYLAQPKTAVWAGLALIYEPPLLDILPIYVLFMLASPWVLTFALQRGWRGVMAASIALWVLSQFGLSRWIYAAAVDLTGLSVPYREMGSFDTFSWQLLWIAGLCIGAGRAMPDAKPLRFPGGILALASVLALAGVIWRHAGPFGQVPFGDASALNWLFDKWQLGPLRLVNLIALGIVAVRFGPAFARWLPRMHWLEIMGAASLPVFCAHLVAVLLTLTWFGESSLARPWWGDLLLLAVVFAFLQAVARFSQRPHRKKMRDTEIARL